MLPTLLEKAHCRGELLALLFIDLDGFKLVNDSLGHAVGDALLVQVAASLRLMVRQEDIVARLGGDEFMVILSDIKDTETAISVADSLLNAVSQPVRAEGNLLTMGASIGVSSYPADSTVAEELIHHADCAMYAAKRAGKKRVVRFTTEMGDMAQERQTLESQLRGAVARNEIHMHYQPEFDLQDQRLIRFEALARWTHPVLGEIPPLKFIPVAEETGIIHELGAYLLETACIEAVRWQAMGPIHLGVNISSLQFHRQGFVELVSETLERTGLDPKLLQIEFTESVMLSGSPETEMTMHRLRAMGIQLAVDDFGTGYSNLSYLPSLPFDSLKIGGSFVRHLGAKPGAESLIQTLIHMAHNFGMRVIVEGVEKQEQLDHIRSCGADEVQGYLTGRPSADPMLVIEETIVV
jgi:diguanylate cyclase (GGDEF)-like protein